MIRTVLAEVAEGHAAWEQQQQTYHLTQKFLLRFLGVLHAHQYTLKQLHGAFSLEVEGDTQP
jgi:hypothetical protein